MPRTSRRSTGSVPPSSAADSIAAAGGGRRGGRTVGASAAVEHAASPKSKKSKREEEAAKAKRWAEERKRKREEKKRAAAGEDVDKKSSAAAETPARSSRRRKKLDEEKDEHEGKQPPSSADSSPTKGRSPSRKKKFATKAYQETKTRTSARAKGAASPSSKKKKVDEDESSGSENEQNEEEEKKAAATSERKKKRQAKLLRNLRDAADDSALTGGRASRRRRTEEPAEKKGVRDEEGDSKEEKKTTPARKKRVAAAKTSAEATPKRSSRRKASVATSPLKEASSSESEEEKERDESSSPERKSLKERDSVTKPVASRRFRTAAKGVEEKERSPSPWKRVPRKNATASAEEESDGEANIDEADNRKVGKKVTPAKRKKDQLDFLSSSDDDEDKKKEVAEGKKSRRAAAASSLRAEVAAESTERRATLGGQRGEGKAAPLPSVPEDGDAETTSMAAAVPLVGTIVAAKEKQLKEEAGTPSLVRRLRKHLAKPTVVDGAAVAPKVEVKTVQKEEGEADEETAEEPHPPAPVSLPQRAPRIAAAAAKEKLSSPPRRSPRKRAGLTSPSPEYIAGTSGSVKKAIDDEAAGEKSSGEVDGAKGEHPATSQSGSSMAGASDIDDESSASKSLFRPMPRSMSSFRKRLKSTIPLGDDADEAGEVSLGDIVRTGLTHLFAVLAFALCACVFYILIDGTAHLWGPGEGSIESDEDNNSSSGLDAAKAKVTSLLSDKGLSEAVDTLWKHPSVSTAAMYLVLGAERLSFLRGGALSVFAAGLAMGIWAGGSGESGVWGDTVITFACGTVCGALMLKGVADLLI